MLWILVLICLGLIVLAHLGYRQLRWSETQFNDATARHNSFRDEWAKASADNTSRIRALEQEMNSLGSCDTCGGVYLGRRLWPRTMGARNTICPFCVQKLPAPLQNEAKKARRVQLDGGAA